MHSAPGTDPNEPVEGNVGGAVGLAREHELCEGLALEERGLPVQIRDEPDTRVRANLFDQVACLDCVAHGPSISFRVGTLHSNASLFQRRVPLRSDGVHALAAELPHLRHEPAHHEGRLYTVPARARKKEGVPPGGRSPLGLHERKKLDPGGGTRLGEEGEGGAGIRANLLLHLFSLLGGSLPHSFYTIPRPTIALTGEKSSFLKLV